MAVAGVVGNIETCCNFSSNKHTHTTGVVSSLSVCCTAPNIIASLNCIIPAKWSHNYNGYEEAQDLNDFPLLN